MENIVFKYQLIWIKTLGEEAFCVTPPPTRFFMLGLGEMGQN